MSVERSKAPEQLVPEQTGSPNGDRAERRVQSVDRALSMLEHLARFDSPVALNDLALAVDLKVSTCHHILSTLVLRGYVLHAGRNRGYMLSSRLHELAELSSHAFDLVDFVRPELQALNDDLKESVQMAVLLGAALITKLRITSRVPTHMEPDEVRKMRAAHATATGKAILAWLPEVEMARVVSETGLERFTPNTLTTLSGLIEDLRLVRRRGYAVDEEELQANVICYGAALREGSGAVIGSISVSIPKSRANPQYRTHVSKGVVACAQAISNRMRAGGFSATSWHGPT